MNFCCSTNYGKDVSCLKAPVNEIKKHSEQMGKICISININDSLASYREMPAVLVNICSSKSHLGEYLSHLVATW